MTSGDILRSVVDIERQGLQYTKIRQPLVPRRGYGCLNNSTFWQGTGRSLRAWQACAWSWDIEGCLVLGPESRSKADGGTDLGAT